MVLIDNLYNLFERIYKMRHILGSMMLINWDIRAWDLYEPDFDIRIIGRAISSAIHQGSRS